MKKSKTVCGKCKETVEYIPAVVKRSSMGVVPCPFCGYNIRPVRTKKGRTDAQKRSKDQEERSAKRNRARRQAGSGSSPRAKGDIKDRGRLHGECKHTINKSFTLKLAELLKTEKESRAGELVLFEIEFQGVYPFKRYVVLEEGQFQAMQDELTRLREAEPYDQMLDRMVGK